MRTERQILKSRRSNRLSTDRVVERFRVRPIGERLNEHSCAADRNQSEAKRSALELTLLKSRAVGGENQRDVEVGKLALARELRVEPRDRRIGPRGDLPGENVTCAMEFKRCKRLQEEEG